MLSVPILAKDVLCPVVALAVAAAVFCVGEAKELPLHFMFKVPSKRADVNAQDKLQWTVANLCLMPPM